MGKGERRGKEGEMEKGATTVKGKTSAEECFQSRKIEIAFTADRIDWARCEERYYELDPGPFHKLFLVRKSLSWSNIDGE